MTNPEIDEGQIVQTTFNAKHGVKTDIVGRLGRRKPFSRVKPDADVIEAIGGHHVMTHPYVFAPSIGGALLFFFLFGLQSPNATLATIYAIAAIGCIVIAIIQYIYVINNYAIITPTHLILVYLSLSGSDTKDYRLSQISNWGLSRNWLQMVIFFINVGNLKPDVLGEATHKTLRNIRFAKQVKEVGSTLGSRNRGRMEVKEDQEILETRGNTIVNVEILRQLCQLNNNEFPRMALIKSLVANGWRPEMAERLFERVMVEPGEDPPPLFAEQLPD